MYGLIQYFLSLSQFSVAVIYVTPLTPSSNYCFPAQLHVLKDLIVPVVVESSVVVISVDCLLYKCVFISVSDSVFIVNPPNLLLHD